VLRYNALDVLFDVAVVVHHLLEWQREASQQRDGVIDL